MAEVPLISSITFSNQDGILFCTVVLARIFHATRCCVVVTLYCISSPESPESCKNIICIYCTFLLSATIIISWLYTSLGYVSISSQVMYPPCFQHTKFYPESAFYTWIDSSFVFHKCVCWTSCHLFYLTSVLGTKYE